MIAGILFAAVLATVESQHPRVSLGSSPWTTVPKIRPTPAMANQSGSPVGSGVGKARAIFCSAAVRARS